MSLPKINYDFSKLVGAADIVIAQPTYSNLKELKQELNRFFKDATCLDIIYTKNTDKIFFGMSVIPVISDKTVYDIVADKNPIRFTEYYIEIDSKLLDINIDLDAREFVAILLHEIGHMVNDSQPTEDVRKCIDVYLAKNKESISLNDSVHYREILRYGIQNTLRKVTSIFEIKDDELHADEFVYRCGFGEELQSALNKITKNSFLVNKDVKDKMIVLSWALRLYKEVKFRRIPALKTLQKGKYLTGSKLEIKEMEKVSDSLKKIDDESLIESMTYFREGNLIDNLKKKISETRKAVTYRGIKGYEDDLYEYSVRVKHLYDEDDALMLLRDINTKISILNDYVSNEEMSEQERNKWFRVLDNYYKVRDELAKKKLYKFDYRAPVIQVNYPDIVPGKT